MMLFNEHFCPRQAILGKWFLADILGHITEIIVLSVAGEAQERCDDKLRWSSGACPLHRRANDVETLSEIGAVDFTTFEAVATGALGQRFAGEFALVRRGIGVM